MVHILTIGTEIIKQHTSIKSGYGYVMGVKERSYIVDSILSTDSFRVKFEDCGSLHYSKVFKINGNKVEDGDTIHIYQKDITKHNPMNVGNFSEMPISRYTDDFKIIEYGKIKIAVI